MNPLKSESKDSQDWLDDWIKKVEGIWSVAYANAPRSEDGVEATYMKKAIKELERDAKSAIREHFLKEALEMIGKDDRDYSGDNTDHDTKIILIASSTACNDLRAEFRNKFNNTWGSK